MGIGEGVYLLVKVSVNRFVSRRIEAIRKEVKDSTQRLRMRTLKDLEEIFRMAARVARGEVTHQRVNGKMVRISLKQRRRWLSLAAQTAKTMKSISSSFNEEEVQAQLNELERLATNLRSSGEDD